jgi:hypothetical protein
MTTARPNGPSIFPECLCGSDGEPHWHHDLLCPKRPPGPCCACAAEHRLEAFHVICRDCESRDAYFARDPDRFHLGLRAVCPKCGTWEYIE